MFLYKSTHNKGSCGATSPCEEGTKGGNSNKICSSGEKNMFVAPFLRFVSLKFNYLFYDFILT